MWIYIVQLRNKNTLKAGVPKVLRWTYRTISWWPLAAWL